MSGMLRQEFEDLIGKMAAPVLLIDRGVVAEYYVVRAVEPSQDIDGWSDTMIVNPRSGHAYRFIEGWNTLDLYKNLLKVGNANIFKTETSLQSYAQVQPGDIWQGPASVPVLVFTDTITTNKKGLNMETFQYRRLDEDMLRKIKITGKLVIQTKWNRPASPTSNWAEGLL